MKKLVIVAEVSDGVAKALEYGDKPLAAWVEESLGVSLECDCDSDVEWGEEVKRRWGVSKEVALRAFRVKMARVEDKTGETGAADVGGCILAQVGGGEYETLRTAAKAMNAAGTCGKRNTALSVFRESPWSWAEKYLEGGELAGDILAAHDGDETLAAAFREAGLLGGEVEP